MPYIYVMRPWTKDSTSASEGYVGQENRTSDGEYERITEHARSAYGLRGGKLSGAARLIQKYGASAVSVDVFPIEEGYGLGPNLTTSYEAFLKDGWTAEDNGEDAMLTFAEIIWILSGFGGETLLGDISTYNATIGDKSLFKYSVTADKALKQAIIDTANAMKIDGLNSGSFDTSMLEGTNFDEVFITFGSTREDFVKIFNPKLYACRRAFQYLLKMYAFSGDKFEKEFSTRIAKHVFKFTDNISAIRNECQQYLKECTKECLPYWQKTVKEINLDVNFSSDTEVSLDYETLVEDVIKWLEKNFTRDVITRLANTIAEYNDKSNLVINILKFKIQGNAISLNTLTTGIKKQGLKLHAKGYSRVGLQLKGVTEPQWYKEAINGLNTTLRARGKEGHSSNITVINIFKKASYDGFKQAYHNTVMQSNPVRNRLDAVDQDAPGSTISGFFKQETLNVRLKTYIQKMGFSKESSIMIHWDQYCANCMAIVRQDDYKSNWEMLTDEEHEATDGRFTYAFSQITKLSYGFLKHIWAAINWSQDHVGGGYNILRYY